MLPLAPHVLQSPHRHLHGPLYDVSCPEFEPLKTSLLCYKAAGSYPAIKLTRDGKCIDVAHYEGVYFLPRDPLWTQCPADFVSKWKALSY